MTGKPLTPQQIEAIVADYLKGYTLYKVASMNGVSFSSAQRFCRKAGVIRTARRCPRESQQTDKALSDD